MNIIINGHSFYEVEAKEVSGKLYHLLESEVYGEEYCIIVDNDNNFVMATCNGFMDLEDFLEEEAYEEAKNEIIKSISVKEENFFLNMKVNGLGKAEAYLNIFKTDKYKYNVIYTETNSDFLQGVVNLYEDGHITNGEAVQAVDAFVNHNALYIACGAYGVAVQGAYDDVILFFAKKV